jgi:hypothetical protein
MKLKEVNLSTGENSMKELMLIPGVGKSIAQDLLKVGIKSIQDLKGKNPETLYDLINKKTGVVQDRCLLYVFRCAVYYASTKEPYRSPDKLKWWNWTDSKIRGEIRKF